jgi:phospholipase C
VAGSSAETAEKSEAQYLVSAFARDVAADSLPQVSWIVAPARYSEHPEAPPAFGESLTARLLAALVANPKVWAKTALILNYDENDGFFDHVPGPVPVTRAQGLSSVDTRGEAYKGEPVGLGIRVPLLVVSPWTRGGFVHSGVNDHTSVIRFLERRFGVMEPNISPWRRAVTGDLVDMFDFADPDGAAIHALQSLPAIGDYHARRRAALPKPQPPAQQAMPAQEPGQRPARALPYRLAVSEAGEGADWQLVFANTGRQGAVFQVYDRGGTGRGPIPWRRVPACAIARRAWRRGLAA